MRRRIDKRLAAETFLSQSLLLHRVGDLEGSRTRRHDSGAMVCRILLATVRVISNALIVASQTAPTNQTNDEKERPT